MKRVLVSVALVTDTSLLSVFDHAALSGIGPPEGRSCGESRMLAADLCLHTVVAEPGMSGSEAPGTEVRSDKDPLPGFDSDIEKFKSYLRELKMWRHETVPAKKLSRCCAF